jgi:hypothetical protein
VAISVSVLAAAIVAACGGPRSGANAFERIVRLDRYGTVRGPQRRWRRGGWLVGWGQRWELSTSSSPLGPWKYGGRIIDKFPTGSGQDAPTNHSGVARLGD